MGVLCYSGGMKQTLFVLLLCVLSLPLRAQEPEPADPSMINGFRVTPIEIGFGRPAECVADRVDSQGRFWRVGLSERGAAHLFTVPSDQVSQVEPMRGEEVTLYIGHAPPIQVSAQASGLGALLLLSRDAVLIERLLTADRLRLEWSEHTVALAYGDFNPVYEALQSCIAVAGAARGSRLDRINAKDMEKLVSSVLEEARLFKEPPFGAEAWEDSASPAARFRIGPAGGVVMLVGYLNEAGLDAWSQQNLSSEEGQCPEVLGLQDLELREESIPVDAMRVVMSDCKIGENTVRVRFIVALMHGAIGLTVITEAVMPADRRSDLGTRVLAQSDALVGALSQKLKNGWPERVE